MPATNPSGQAPAASTNLPDALDLGSSVFANLLGARAATRYAGGTSSGAPTSGTFATGDFVIDQTGAVWVCTAAGAPGTWSGLAAPATTSFGGALLDTASISAARTANLLYLINTAIPVSTTLTGVAIRNGATATGNVEVGLYNAAGTSLLASSSSTGQTGTSATQRIAFSSTLAVTPGIYIIAVIFSSSSATAATGDYAGGVSTAAQGGFSLPTSVTVPTTGTGPVTIATTY